MCESCVLSAGPLVTAIVVLIAVTPHCVVLVTLSSHCPVCWPTSDCHCGVTSHCVVLVTLSSHCVWCWKSVLLTLNRSVETQHYKRKSEQSVQSVTAQSSQHTEQVRISHLLHLQSIYNQPNFIMKCVCKQCLKLPFK